MKQALLSYLEVRGSHSLVAVLDKGDEKALTALPGIGKASVPSSRRVPPASRCPLFPPARF